MLLESVWPGGIDVPTQDGQDRRLVACGERFEVEGASGARLVAIGRAVAVGPDGSTATARVRYTGLGREGLIDLPKLRKRVEYNAVVSVPLWAANQLVSEQPADWRKEA